MELRDIRNYEVSIWTLQDSFIAVLKHAGLENKGQILQPELDLIDDGTQEFNFKIPMYIQKNGEKIENPIWYDVVQKKVIVADLKKIKVIINKKDMVHYVQENEPQNQQKIYQFLITKVSQSHDAGKMYCQVSCEGLAFHELGKIGYRFSLSHDVYLQEYAKWTKLTEEQQKHAQQPRETLQYWNDQIFNNLKHWDYEVRMNWDGYQSGSTKRDSKKVYEDSYVSSWNGNNGQARTVQISKEKQRPINMEESNVYNLTQTIAETFGVFCRYEYEHDDNYHIIGRKVIYYNNFLNEKYGALDLTYPYSTSSITREMDGTDLITKMFVKPVETQTSDSGYITILNTAANRSGQDYLLNFDYLRDTGTITQEQYAQVKKFQIEMFKINSQLAPLASQIVKLRDEKIKYQAQVTLYTNSVALARQRAAAADSFISNLTDNTGVLQVTSLKPDTGILLQDSSNGEEDTSDYYLRITQTGIIPETLHIYREYRYTAVGTDRLANEISGVPQYDQFGNLIRINKIYPQLVNNGNSNALKRTVYLTYQYKPLQHYQNIKNTWQNKQRTDSERLDQSKRKLQVTEKLLEQKQKRYEDRINQKKQKIQQFQTMMGPALREGYWMPEDYKDYGDKYSAKFNEFSLGALVQDENQEPKTDAYGSYLYEYDNTNHYVTAIWDRIPFDGEQLPYYESGVNREKVFYPCIKLSDQQLKFIQTHQNVSLIFHDLYMNQTLQNTRAFTIGSKCQLGFLKQNEEVIPVLYVTGADTMTKDQIKIMQSEGEHVSVSVSTDYRREVTEPIKESEIDETKVEEQTQGGITTKKTINKTNKKEISLTNIFNSVGNRIGYKKITTEAITIRTTIEGNNNQSIEEKKIITTEENNYSEISTTIQVKKKENGSQQEVPEEYSFTKVNSNGDTIQTGTKSGNIITIIDENQNKKIEIEETNNLLVKIIYELNNNDTEDQSDDIYEKSQKIEINKNNNTQTNYIWDNNDWKEYKKITDTYNDGKKIKTIIEEKVDNDQREIEIEYGYSTAENGDKIITQTSREILSIDENEDIEYSSTTVITKIKQSSYSQPQGQEEENQNSIKVISTQKKTIIKQSDENIQARLGIISYEKDTTNNKVNISIESNDSLLIAPMYEMIFDENTLEVECRLLSNSSNFSSKWLTLNKENYKSYNINDDSNTDESTESVDTDQPNQYSVVYPRIQVDSLALKQSSTELCICYNDVPLELYQDYSVLTRNDKYYITFKAEALLEENKYKLPQEQIEQETQNQQALQEQDMDKRPLFDEELRTKINNGINFQYLKIYYCLSNADTSIYLDAIQVLKENSYPKTSYQIQVNVINKDFIKTIYNKMGYIAHINDNDLKFENVLGYISQIHMNLAAPWQDEIVIKNYKTKFQDLFSKIVASSQQMQKSAYIIGVAAGAFNSDGTISSSTLSSSILKVDLNYAFNNGTLTINQRDGIWGVSDSGVVAIRGGGIFTSTTKDSNGNWIWNTGITPEGINANLITSGQLDTSRIKIYAGDKLRLQMNEEGLFAYKSFKEDFDFILPEDGEQLDKQISSQEETDGFTKNQYVKFSQNGLFLTAQRGAQVYNKEKHNYQELKTTVNRVQVSWSGFKLRNWKNEEVFYADPDTGNLVLDGTIFASLGRIGGFTIGDTYLTSGQQTKFEQVLTNVDTGVYIGNDGISLGGGTFSVSNAGHVAAVAGTIGNWKMSNGVLYSAPKKMVNGEEVDNWKQSIVLNAAGSDFKQGSTTYAIWAGAQKPEENIDTSTYTMTDEKGNIIYEDSTQLELNENGDYIYQPLLNVSTGDQIYHTVILTDNTVTAINDINLDYNFNDDSDFKLSNDGTYIYCSATGSTDATDETQIVESQTRTYYYYSDNVASSTGITYIQGYIVSIKENLASNYTKFSTGENVVKRIHTAEFTTSGELLKINNININDYKKGVGCYYIQMPSAPIGNCYIYPDIESKIKIDDVYYTLAFLVNQTSIDKLNNYNYAYQNGYSFYHKITNNQINDIPITNYNIVSNTRYYIMAGELYYAYPLVTDGNNKALIKMNNDSGGKIVQGYLCRVPGNIVINNVNFSDFNIMEVWHNAEFSSQPATVESINNKNIQEYTVQENYCYIKIIDNDLAGNYFIYPINNQNYIIASSGTTKVIKCFRLNVPDFQLSKLQNGSINYSSGHEQWHTYTNDGEDIKINDNVEENYTIVTDKYCYIKIGNNIQEQEIAPPSDEHESGQIVQENDDVEYYIFPIKNIGETAYYGFSFYTRDGRTVNGTAKGYIVLASEHGYDSFKSGIPLQINQTATNISIKFNFINSNYASFGKIIQEQVKFTDTNVYIYDPLDDSSEADVLNNNNNNLRNRWDNVRTVYSSENNTSSTLYKYVYVKKSAYENNFTSEGGAKKSNTMKLLGKNNDSDINNNDSNSNGKKTQNNIYIYLMGPSGPSYESYSDGYRIKVYTPIYKKVPKTIEVVDGIVSAPFRLERSGALYATNLYTQDLYLMGKTATGSSITNSFTNLITTIGALESDIRSLKTSINQVKNLGLSRSQSSDGSVTLSLVQGGSKSVNFNSAGSVKIQNTSWSGDKIKIKLTNGYEESFNSNINHSLKCSSWTGNSVTFSSSVTGNGNTISTQKITMKITFSDLSDRVTLSVSVPGQGIIIQRVALKSSGGGQSPQLPPIM